MRFLIFKRLPLIMLIFVLSGCLLKSNGPTEAPDLVEVSNFRAGPTTQSGPTTAVDFTFDQAAYLKWRRSFELSSYPIGWRGYS
ncbi:hypothetical protein [Radiobacillus deserti]|uniref:Uncharacterized protein n=1 Tax=Radiobacillus deserti TaxID=2594883 RepID=A0A516KDC5_9BACI|nr:hypothetical protein [Radiobacillus deserti]QDP39306.1 hypothetical protein FN924_03320 [Radiobacillus deserti]